MTAFPAQSKRFEPRMRGILQRTRPPANNAPSPVVGNREKGI